MSDVPRARCPKGVDAGAGGVEALARARAVLSIVEAVGGKAGLASGVVDADVSFLEIEAIADSIGGIAESVAEAMTWARDVDSVTRTVNLVSFCINVSLSRPESTGIIRGFNGHFTREFDEIVSWSSVIRRETIPNKRAIVRRWSLLTFRASSRTSRRKRARLRRPSKRTMYLNIGTILRSSKRPPLHINQRRMHHKLHPIRRIRQQIQHI